ncbi:hypothetical protein GCM10009610_48230 [Pseudonocardia xinjiangensis]
MVARCLLSEWDALVEVHVAVPLALPGTADAVGRARAGPAEPDPAGTPATSAAPPHPGLVHVGAPRVWADIDTGPYLPFDPDHGPDPPSDKFV